MSSPPSSASPRSSTSGSPPEPVLPGPQPGPFGRFDHVIVAHLESWALLRGSARGLDAPVLVDIHNVMSPWLTRLGRTREARAFQQIEDVVLRDASAVSVCSPAELARLSDGGWLYGSSRRTGSTPRSGPRPASPRLHPSSACSATGRGPRTPPGSPGSRRTSGRACGRLSPRRVARRRLRDPGQVRRDRRVPRAGADPEPLHPHLGVPGRGRAGARRGRSPVKFGRRSRRAAR
ncbi:glycosyltransferase [Oerskovia sp. M15]